MPISLLRWWLTSMRIEHVSDHDPLLVRFRPGRERAWLSGNLSYPDIVVELVDGQGRSLP